MQDQNLQSSSSKNEPTPFGNGADKSGGAGVMDAAKSTSMDLLEKARSTAGEAYGTVTEKATSKLEEGKVGLSGGLSSVADSIRKVADGLKDSPENGPVADYSARYAETAAEKLQQAAGYFEQQDLAAITRDVESYARRNTAIFLGAAFALGVLAARFIKSSPSSDTPQLTSGTSDMSTSIGGGSGLSTSGTGKQGSSSTGATGTTGSNASTGSTGTTGSGSTGGTGRTGSSDPGLESSARGV